MGFQHFDPALTIAGVIVNRVNSDSHYQLLKHAIEHYCGIPALGYVPVTAGVALPERHLGLVTARESVIDSQSGVILPGTSRKRWISISCFP